MIQCNGRSLILDGGKVLAATLSTDASNTAVGAVFQDKVIYQVLSMSQRSWHINVKELFAFVVAVREWGHLWTRKHIRFVPRIGAQLDNTTAIAWINKGTSKDKHAMVLLRELFWRSATLGFRVTCAHIAGVKNVIADAAYRLQFARIPKQFRVRKARPLLASERKWIERLSFT